MTLSNKITQHEIRLEMLDDLYQGSCSCDWVSAGSGSRADAAIEAVGHSNSCDGDATMGA